MSFKPYKAIVNESQVYYWSQYDSSDNRNLVDAGKAYLTKHPEDKKLQVLDVEHVTMNEIMTAANCAVPSNVIMDLLNNPNVKQHKFYWKDDENEKTD